MSINCKSKKNKNKSICKKLRFVNVEEYSKREISDLVIFIPLFFGFVFLLSWLGILPQEDKTTLIYYTIISALASVGAFLISRFIYMKKR